MRAVELFAGAGGLAMGVSRAGFDHEAVIEWNQWACETLRENQRRGIAPVSKWPEVFQGDVRDFDFAALRPGVELVAGGPPCQPFSLGGKHRGHRDHRDMFPAATRAVREIDRPGRRRPHFSPEARGRPADKCIESLFRVKSCPPGGMPVGPVRNRGSR